MGNEEIPKSILNKTTIFILVNIFIWFPVFCSNVYEVIYYPDHEKMYLIEDTINHWIVDLSFYISGSLSGICNYIIWVKYVREIVLVVTPIEGAGISNLSTTLLSSPGTPASWDSKTLRTT